MSPNSKINIISKMNRYSVIPYYNKNKWIIAHTENEALINRGIFAGITGINFKIKY